MTVTLKQKLLAGFALNCALTVASSLCIMLQVRHMRSIESQINSVRTPSVLAATRLGRYISDCSFTFRNFLLYSDDAAVAAKSEAARQVAWKNLFGQYDILKKLAPQEDDALLAQLDSDIRNGSLKIQVDAIADMTGHGAEGKAKALERMKGGAAFAAKVQADALEVTRRVEARLAEDNDALATAQTTTWVMALVTGLLTSVSGVVIGMLLGRQILSGISKISGRIAEVAEGDLSGALLVHGVHDEIGAAVESINRMQASLCTMILDVIGSANEVAGAAVELSVSSKHLLENANAQKDQSHQIVSAMHEMGAAIAEVSNNAARAAQGAVSAREEAHDGGQVVGQTVAAMQTLTEASRATSSQIEGLAKSSDEIGRIASVISEIAEQTNLLALNAAIEAARAGEQGRGFAVVAGEVRRLAERTGQATREIDTMISSIQKEAKNAVESIKNEIAHVNQSAETAAQAGESINGIIQASDNVKEMISQIATASHQQSAATEEVNHNMNEIVRIIDLSTAGTQSSAKACEELSRLATQMQEAVSHFRLERRTTQGRRTQRVKAA